MFTISLFSLQFKNILFNDAVSTGYVTSIKYVIEIWYFGEMGSIYHLPYNWGKPKKYNMNPEIVLIFHCFQI